MKRFVRERETVQVVRVTGVCGRCRITVGFEGLILEPVLSQGIPTVCKDELSAVRRKWGRSYRVSESELSAAYGNVRSRCRMSGMPT